MTTTEELLKKPMLKVAEAAQLMCVNHKTVREMIERQELPHRRFGRAVRIPTSAVRSLTMQDRVMPPRSSDDGGET